MPTSNTIKICRFTWERDGDTTVPRSRIPRSAAAVLARRTTKTCRWIIGCVSLDRIMSFSSDVFLDRCFSHANKTTHVREPRKFQRQIKDTTWRFSLSTISLYIGESHAILKAGRCVVSRFRSRGDSLCSAAKCTKYINLPDDGGCPNFAFPIGN